MSLEALIWSSYQLFWKGCVLRKEVIKPKEIRDSWLRKKGESSQRVFFYSFLIFFLTNFVSRGSLWLWNRRRRKSFLNNNIHMPWERWSRRLSKKPSYFIALRHYSFSWHIMFLIKIACELIKVFTQALFCLFLHGFLVTLLAFW